jgi:hypothetical protein
MVIFFMDRSEGARGWSIIIGFIRLISSYI